jgi:hypothetical protein
MDFLALMTTIRWLHTDFQKEKRMKSSLLLVLLAASMTSVLVGCESYPRYGEVDVRDPYYATRVVFTDHDRRLINDYYEPRYRKLPPGQAKRDRLPPGHAWRARHNQPIHEDARWRYLPNELDQRLSRLPSEYVRVIIGTDMVIMNVRTRVVVDMLEDITD